jgi:hypothetical protein
VADVAGEAHVLQHAAKLYGVPDVRLLGVRQPVALGVAATFNVEDARV